jgi:DNA-binding CsgD family transcriptional regulator
MYRSSGQFSPLEQTILDSAFDGLSLGAIGRRTGMTRQGVEYHIQRLMARVPIFRRFWRYKNRMRARK